MTVVQGRCDEGFGHVADVFATLIDEDSPGGAVTVYRAGRPVVDLWGGLADVRTRAPWTARTLTLVFSVTKGLTSLCAHLLAEQGLLDFDARITAYWPEYGRAGKQETTVRQALAHRAGVPVIDAELAPADLQRWTPIITALENQRPLWTPGTEYGYHALTFGYLAGELIRRITGRTPGQFFRSNVAGPLGADAWIGLPAEEESRVALLLPPPPPAEDSPVAAMLSELLTPEGVLFRSATLGGAIPAGVDVTAPDGFNSRAVREAEVPAGNGVMSAHALARIYAAAVTEVGGVRLLGADAAKNALAVESAGPVAAGFVDFGVAFSTGFMLGSEPVRPMLGAGSFGHDGAGGALGFADVDHGIGFGYVSSQMGGMGDERANELCRALRRCLEGATR